MKNRIIKRLSMFILFIVAFFLTFNLNVVGFELSLEPTGICVSYYDDIDSRGFAWQTSLQATETNLLVVKDEGQEVDWNSITPITGTYVDFYDYRCHKAQVTDLEGGNYLYKVGGNDVYSEVGKFIIDDVNDNKVSFTYVADSQETSVEGFEYFNKTLNTAVTHSPDFIAFAGDIVDNSHAGWGTDMTKIKMEEWSYAFDTTKGITMNYPMMSASGNHERAGYSFVNHNNVNFQKELSTGGYYSFDYNNLHFTVLDTNIFEENDQNLIDEQIAWLEQDLANTDKPWKIVMMHIGAYSTGDHSNDSSAILIRNTLPQIFAKYKVDLVLQGHDHVYSRTMPYYYGENENGKVVNRNEKYVNEDGINWSLEPDGTYYITINYCGTKSYAPVEYDSSRIFPAKSPVNGKVMSQEVKNRMFAHVEIDGDKLLLKSYIAKDDGSEELYDYIAIKKNTYVDAINAIDKLEDELTYEDVLDVKQAKDLLEGLSDRALNYVPTSTIEKLNSILANYDLDGNLAIYEVVAAINNLNTTIYDETYFKNYRIAMEGYYYLSDSQKELVDNIDILLGVKDKLAQIESESTRNYLIEGVQRLIDNIETAENKEEARLLAKAAYDLLDEELKELIKNTDLLQETKEEKGCSGSVGASFVAVLLLGIIVLLSRRKRGEYNEEN